MSDVTVFLGGRKCKLSELTISEDGDKVFFMPGGFPPEEGAFVLKGDSFVPYKGVWGELMISQVLFSIDDLIRSGLVPKDLKYSE